MPSKNIVKQFASDGYYHIYNRGVARQNIFTDDEDRAVFLSLFKRHLSLRPSKDRFGREFAHLTDKVDLLAYCLMPNHFHLLVYNITDRGIAEMMQRLMTGYAMYYNKKHTRVGGLFQGTYKASLILEEAYLLHISRYIHLNPLDLNEDYQRYPWSSYPYYLGAATAEWLHADKIMKMTNFSPASYKKFMADYEDYRRELKTIKRLLAT